MGESKARYALVVALAKRLGALRRVLAGSGRVVRSCNWSVARVALRQAGPEVELAALQGDIELISDEALLIALQVFCFGHSSRGKGSTASVCVRIPSIESLNALHHTLND